MHGLNLQNKFWPYNRWLNVMIIRVWYLDLIVIQKNLTGYQNIIIWLDAINMYINIWKECHMK